MRYPVLLPRERFHGGGRKARGENAVESGGRAAALHVAEFYIAQIEAEALAMLAKILHEPFSVVSRAFGHNHNSVALAAIVAIAQATRERFGIGFDFGQRDGFRASGNAGGERQIAAVAAHHLHQKSAFVRRSGHLDAVDGLERDVERGVDADGNFRAAEIVVNGRYADDRNSFCESAQRAGLRAVAADDDGSVDIVFTESANAFELRFAGLEFLKAEAAAAWCRREG